MIKTKLDAEKFIQGMGYSEVGSIEFYDGTLFVGNWGGHTRICRHDTDEYGIFSSGCGWSDHIESRWTQKQVVNYIFAVRKHVNKALRSMEPVSIPHR